MFCSECGAEINDKAVVCPKCGVPVAGARGVNPITEDVPNHMVGAILSTIFCCLIGGIISIVYSAQVNTKLAQDDVAGARAASKTAKTWIWVNVLSALAGWMFWLVAVMLGAASAVAQ